MPAVVKDRNDPGASDRRGCATERASIGEEGRPGNAVSYSDFLDAPHADRVPILTTNRVVRPLVVQAYPVMELE